MDFDNIFAKDENGNIYRGYAVEKSDRIRIVIPKDSIPDNVKKLYAFTGVFPQNAGSAGYYVTGADKAVILHILKNAVIFRIRSALSCFICSV